MVTTDSTRLTGHVKDETGNVYGKLTVIGFAGIRSDHRAFWHCRCECGKLIETAGVSLRRGNSRSCGCTNATLGSRSGSPEHRIWAAMKSRCYNSKTPYYHNYGGRGITICQRWRESFLNFLADMGPKPFPEATIERVDNDAGYSKENCRWATRLEQGQNTRKAQMLTYNGETMCLSAWARRLGINLSTLACRLKRGWSIPKALTTLPRQNGPRYVSYNGETMCLTDWAKKLGVTRAALYNRIKWGWPLDRVFSPKE